MEELRHVRWLGGGSGAGKTTVAARLAAAHDLLVYDTDARMTEHAQRCPPQDAPALQAFQAMSMDERWLFRSPAVMLQSFPWFRGEAFDLVVEDLLQLPRDRVVLVEGFRLLPRLVAPLLSVPRQAVWLVPTAAFRRAAFASRGELWKIAGRTGDPSRALANLLERDALFTDRVRREAHRRGLSVLEVGTGTTEHELVRRTSAALGLGDGAERST